ERAAAARQDQHIAFGPGAGQAQRRGDLRRRGGALDGDGIDQHRDAAEAPLQNVQDVAHRRARGGGDDADALRHAWQRALALGGEQALGGEPGLELLEPASQRAFAGFLEMIDDELVFTARLIEADAPARLHVHAVLGRESDEAVALTEHGAAHLRGLVLEGEVPVPRGGAREIGELALHPERREAALEQGAHIAVQAGRCVDPSLGLTRGARRRTRGHALADPQLKFLLHAARLPRAGPPVTTPCGAGWFTAPSSRRTMARFNSDAITYAYSRGSAHFRRRASGAGVLRLPAP